MQTNAYSVRDSVAEVYHVPFFAQSNAVARRMFMNACQDETTSYGKNPADYSLWRVGGFDDETGNVMQVDKPVLVLNGATQRSNENAS
ncbi:MAG: nonstructural protein [Microvirus sp.]|nr:MAG: nonstructural protein [Microvirus sp.]